MRAKLGLARKYLAKKADIKYTPLIKVQKGTVNKAAFQATAKIA